MQTLLGGKYRIIRTIGSGGMGTVYLAENIKLGTKWAVKAVPKRECASFDLLAEPKILKKLNHPALPRIVDIESDEENVYIIEDYIEGVPLDKQLMVKKSFDEATVIEWAKQLCNILSYLHNQKPNPIIYRDLKPSNIIVSADNVVKVIDFGIAREFKKDSGSDTSYMGTRGYAAPEQYGTSQTDARTDIYSLGVTMYHLLTGKSPNEPPYEFRPLRQVNASFSEGIEFIVNKCVQNNPANRYQSTAELLNDLNNIHVFNSVYKKHRRRESIKLLLKCLALLVCIVMIFVSGNFVITERVERYKMILEDGYRYLDKFEFDKALECFEAAIKIEKDNHEPYLAVAQIKYKQGRFDDCLEYLDSIASQMPEIKKEVQYNYLRGTVFYEKGDYETAIEFFEKAHKGDPENKDYPRDLAICYAKTGELEKAEKILDTIGTDGDSEDILNYVSGQILLKEGKTDEAIEKFEETIAITEDEDLKTRSYLELSGIYKDMRHTDRENWTAIEKQIEVLERAVKDLKNEDNLLITEEMAEVYFTAKKYDLSIKKFKRLIELGYERAYIYRNIAIIYQQTGEFDKAEETLETMQEKYPDEYQCYLQFAYLYLETEGLKDESKRDYKKVLENYNLAVQYAPSGKNTSDIQQLTAKIDELRSKGWL